MRTRLVRTLLLWLPLRLPPVGASMLGTAGKHTLNGNIVDRLEVLTNGGHLHVGECRQTHLVQHKL